jgi:hypothetical protein
MVVQCGSTEHVIWERLVQKARKVPNLALVLCDNNLCTNRNDTCRDGYPLDGKSQPLSAGAWIDHP